MNLAGEVVGDVACWAGMVLGLLSFTYEGVALGWVVLAAVIGLVGLYFGGDFLTRGAAGGALRLRLNPLVVGLTVVAIATSLPELVTCLLAAKESPDLAMGNILGSNIANLALILGLAALVAPIRIRLQLLVREVPIMIVITLLFVVLAWGGLGRLEGTLLLVGLVGYLIYNYRQVRLSGEKPQAIEGVDCSEGLAVGAALGAIGGGAVLLAVGADLLVGASVEMAGRLGMSEALIGLTLVAVGTSLPELATSLVAALRGQSDICAGNLIGSNIFNLLLVGGATAMVVPLAVSPSVFYVEIPAMILISLLILPFFRTGYIVSRIEGSVLLAVYGLVMVLAALRPGFLSGM